MAAYPIRSVLQLPQSRSQLGLQLQFQLVWGFLTLLPTADDDIELGFGQQLIANSNTFDCSSTTSWLCKATNGLFPAEVSRLLGQQAAEPLSHWASRYDWLAFAENLLACLHLLHLIVVVVFAAAATAFNSCR